MAKVLNKKYRLAKLLVKLGFRGMVDKAGRPMVKHMERVEGHLSEIFVDEVVTVSLRTGGITS